MLTGNGVWCSIVLYNTSYVVNGTDSRCFVAIINHHHHHHHPTSWDHTFYSEQRTTEKP